MDLALPEHDKPRPTDVAAGSDAWDLWFWSPEGEVGGYVRFELRAGTSWYWAALCGPQRQLVSVLEADAPEPRLPGLEIRASGLWAEVVVQDALDHVTTGLEAFGVGLDDPAEVYGKAWGDQVPLGFDLEWETTAPAALIGDGMHVPCEAHGEILVASEVLDLRGWGHRRRSWGHADWPVEPTWTVVGRLDDGAQLWATGEGAAGAGSGMVGADDAPAVLAVDGDGDGLADGARLRLGDHFVAVEPLAWAPALAGGTRVGRALVRQTTGDGRSGTGWMELVRPDL